MLITQNHDVSVNGIGGRCNLTQSYVYTKCVFLELHKLPDQYAKGSPVVPSRWQFFAQLLNYRLKLLQECLSLQGVGKSCTLTQAIGQSMDVPHNPGV